jgi:hypothetical protein
MNKCFDLLREHSSVILKPWEERYSSGSELFFAKTTGIIEYTLN